MRAAEAPLPGFVFDTSALLVFLNGEQDGDDVERHLLAVAAGREAGHVTFTVLYEIAVAARLKAALLDLDAWDETLRQREAGQS